MPQNATTGALPATVTIPDLPTGTTLTGVELLEAVQTIGGVGNSIQITISQIATTAFGALPAGGGTGQILNKASGANFATQFSNVTQFVAVGTGLATSGSATSIVAAFANATGLSVLGVAGTATLAPAAIVGTADQVLVVNHAGTAVAFGQVNLAATAAVTGVLPGANQAATNLATTGNGGVTGVLPVSNGGQGTSTLTQNGVVFGNGTSIAGITAAPATSSLLAGSGTAPFFTPAPIVGTSIIVGANLATTFSSTVLLALTANATTPSVGAEFAGAWLVGLDSTITGWNIDVFGASAQNGFRRANGTAGGLAAVSSGNVLGSITFAGHDGSAYTGGQGQIQGVAGSNWSAGSHDTAINFNVTPPGSVNVATRGRLSGNGGLSIGSNAISTDPGNGGGRFDGAGTFLANTGLSATATSVLLFGSVASFGIYIGTGVPAVVAGTGSIYLRNDGATNTSRMYVNTNGSTTWTAVNTVA